MLFAFFCRWCLLVVAGATIALVTWASARATLAVRENVRSALILVDQVHKPQEKDALVYLSGLIEPPHVGASTDVALVFDSARRLRPVTGLGSVCTAAVYGLGSGPDRLTVVGVPYGQFAFQRERCLLVGVEAERTVYFLDTRMVLAAAGGNDRAAMDKCLAAMAARGEVALFHPGPTADWLVARDDAERAYPRLPLLGQFTKADASKAIRVAKGTLGRVDWAGMVVTTSDAKLAADVSKRGKVVVHLVAPGGAAAGLGPRVHVHESIAKLGEAIAARAREK